VICRFCGQPVEVDDLLHMLKCDGQQGAIEAAAAAVDDVPMLMAGLDPASYDASKAAAVSVLDSKAAQRDRVEAAIDRWARHGRTDDELQRDLQLDGSSERPRRWELVKQQKIVIRRDHTGAAVKRRTSTGRWAVVWITTRWAEANERTDRCASSTTTESAATSMTSDTASRKQRTA
jgi:hypothetical protein